MQGMSYGRCAAMVGDNRRHAAGLRSLTLPSRGQSYLRLFLCSVGFSWRMVVILAPAGPTYNYLGSRKLQLSLLGALRFPHILSWLLWFWRSTGLWLSWNRRVSEAISRRPRRSHRLVHVDVLR